MQIKKCSCRLLEAPLNQPFRIATGQHSRLANVLFKLELYDGTIGYGEAGVAQHITGETLELTLRNLRHVASSLAGRKLSDYLGVSAWLCDQYSHNMSAVAAVEMAMLDALTRSMKVPLWKLYGASCAAFTTDITIVLADLDETRESCVRFYRRGFRKFKIKIGKEPSTDLRRVKIVKEHCPGCDIYLDANQGFSAGDMLKFLRELSRLRITPALLEQPVPKADWEGLKEVAAKAKVPVCADESASTLADCLRIIKEKAVPCVNIKVMKTGMIQSREIALLCRANGIGLMAGAMMESSLSTMASAHMAAGLGCFRYIDLDTPFFIKPGFDRNPYLSRKGEYDLGSVKQGIGIIPPGE